MFGVVVLLQNKVGANQTSPQLKAFLLYSISSRLPETFAYYCTYICTPKKKKLKEQFIACTPKKTKGAIHCSFTLDVRHDINKFLNRLVC